MQKLSSQLTLGLSLKDEATFANFYAAKNAEIVAELKKTASGQGEKVIYLCGTRGQGCSHLLQAACHYAHQQQKGVLIKKALASGHINQIGSPSDALQFVLKEPGVTSVIIGTLNPKHLRENVSGL